MPPRHRIRTLRRRRTTRSILRRILPRASTLPPGRRRFIIPHPPQPPRRVTSRSPQQVMPRAPRRLIPMMLSPRARQVTPSLPLAVTLRNQCLIRRNMRQSPQAHRRQWLFLLRQLPAQRRCLCPTLRCLMERIPRLPSRFQNRASSGNRDWSRRLNRRTPACLAGFLVVKARTVPISI